MEIQWPVISFQTGETGSGRRRLYRGAAVVAGARRALRAGCHAGGRVRWAFIHAKCQLFISIHFPDFNLL